MAEDKKSSGPTADTPSSEDPLWTAAEKLTTRLDSIERRLWIPPKTPGLQRDDDPWSTLSYVESALEAEFGKPTPAQLNYLSEVEKQVSAVLVDLDGLMNTEVTQFRNEVRKSGVGFLSDIPPVTLSPPPAK